MLLLENWTTPFGLAPFGQIADDDFLPALDAAIEQAKAGIDAIAASPDAPSFDNTILAVEDATHGIDQVCRVFYTLAGSVSTPEREVLQREFAPKLSAFSSWVSGHEALFARVEALWHARDSLDLTPEQARVLMLEHRGYVRRGAKLQGADKARMADIMSRLASLGTAFMQNLLADEREWFMPLLDDDLEGLPDFAVNAARSAGAEKGADGPVVTLSRSLIVPFLQFSPRRDLREVAFKAWAARGANGGGTDNRKVAAEILALRHERAQLLGYADFASYKLETEMAQTPENVEDLLMQVWGPAKAQADADAEILANRMAADGVNGPLQPWDWRYYSESRRKEEHDLDEAEIKPYLALDQMIKAAFDCATRLFGLEFTPVDVDLYHPDARAWDVTRGGKHIALFIGDYFARGGKRSGAWCSAMRGQQKKPQPKAPIVINVCNFAKPMEGQPALLSFDDACALFHEFGHALHQMLSDVDYASVSGTSVARDFVELPSQLYEHWLTVPEVLQKFALHVETGQPMPDDLLTRVLGAATYDMGFATVEYVASALVDLAFHRGAPPNDPMAAQAQVLAGIDMPPAITMRHATPHFAHVFAGDGYSSGYYSYMWSEVMDADAFEAFEEAGNAFDPATAKRLEDTVLSKGGSVAPGDLYTQFRGALPNVDALMKGRGLVVG
ncbi:MAG: M3 family metallopeptidase [Planktomarina sp.]